MLVLSSSILNNDRSMTAPHLHDSFGRKIDYLRLSVTDRCDFRCVYCMSDDMTFMPRKAVLTLEELERLSQAFVDLGVKRIRVTGGEPLVRKDAIHLLNAIGHIKGLDELSMSTNASMLGEYAHDIFNAGVKRLNISLDSLNPQRFKQLTRHGNLDTVLRNIDIARALPFKKIKINAVLMRNFNVDETSRLAHYALERDMNISFIEEMPLGDIKSHARDAEFISSEEVRSLLADEFSLTASDYRTGGPSRYWDAKGYTAKIGFISPHSENFCASCNRVRVTASGRLLLCLGNEHSIDLKTLLRSNESDVDIKKAIATAMNIKPEKHIFDLHQPVQIVRFMNATGG